MSDQYKYLFGPVPSRRLGRSLGLDVTPMKTCSFDCLFCQLGCTTHLAAERSEFIPFDKVCAELERWLKTNGEADWITFAGSGEPTLYSRLGELIDFVKARTDIPVMLLTNGTLFHREEVRAEARKADTVKASLSAWDEASFQKINRPAPGLTFEQLIAGERAFRNDFSSAYWLEVFLIEGINTEPEQVQRIAALAAEIRPDKIHLNTAVRPPAEISVQPVSKEKLDALCGLFTPHAEVIASFAAPSSRAGDISSDTLVELVKRHPATAVQLAGMFGVAPGALLPLLDDTRVQTEVRGDETYYICR